MIDDAPLLVAVAFAVALINLPFGYWRAGTRKFSARWFVAVHGPVPAVVALRLMTGVPLSLRTLPVLVSAYFGGQLLGARMRGRRREGARPLPGGAGAGNAAGHAPGDENSDAP